MGQFGGGQFGPFGTGGGSIPPSPGLSLVSVGDGEVTLHYTAATVEDSGWINADDGIIVSTPFATSGTGNYTVTGLTNGKLYFFTAQSELNGELSYPTPTVRAVPGGPADVDDAFESYVRLTLQAEVKDILALAALPLQVFGFRNPVVEESVEKWIAIDILSFPRKGSRRQVWRGTVLFQITCFARDAAEITGQDTEASQRVASTVARAMENKHFRVRTYGAASVDPVCDMAIGVPKMITLPPREGTNVWAVAVTFDGYIHTH